MIFSSRRKKGGVLRLYVAALALVFAGCAGQAGRPIPGASSPGEASAPARSAPEQASEPEGAPLATTGIFTDAQGDRGRIEFDETCADCHTNAEFRGRGFERTWGRRTVYSFFRTIRSTMPDDDPGGLRTQQYLDITAYILRMNGHAAGAEPLTEESDMRGYRIIGGES